MPHLDQLEEPMRSMLSNMPCPAYEGRPWVTGPPLAERRVAIISTAGLHCRDDRPFEGISGDYRVIPGDTPAADLLMSHISTNFDRTGFQRDWNVAFPLERLRELVQTGEIASVADYHYSFMGATDPTEMASSAHNLAQLLQRDEVNAALLVPV